MTLNQGAYFGVFSQALSMKFLFLLPIILAVCTACTDNSASNPQESSEEALPEQRIIAEVYQVIEVANIGCYLKPDEGSYRLASLSHGQTVQLVLEGEQSIWHGNELWLHVEGAVKGNAACFIKAQYLEPSNE
ncbi:MAG: Unknown protein [uncultured Thiotrichaceae bacterium]|uniref:SH3b domain-containing protein n=1 Tax=uncultured Thiotrichaceae bacterium TaxID=298394 RepID=A0A6S6U230_9GAMM|nr:MAG: Unknown protein [uncultured Thiotrichaceae bacterium]